MEPLRVTHLSRHREGWDCELGYDGWFLRFSSSEQDAFDEMRDELKTWGRTYARWIPAYRWSDGKEGAWWIDSELFRDHYTDQFEGLQEAMAAILDDDVLQWIAPRRARQARTRTPKSKVPVYLYQDYCLLQLEACATRQEIKDAYRRLSKVHHPDAGGTHEGFIRLQKSYERVLKWAELTERVAV